MKKAFVLLLALGFLMVGCGTSSSTPKTTPAAPLMPAKPAPKTAKVLPIKPPPSPIKKATLIVPARPLDVYHFYAQASVEFLSSQLPPGSSLGNQYKDSKNYDLHYNWAVKQNPQTLKAELIDKFSLMVSIKASRGKPELAQWYAMVCSRMGKYGIDFGSPAANSTNYSVHEKWALSPNITPQVLRDQLIMRLERIFASYGY